MGLQSYPECHVLCWEKGPCSHWALLLLSYLLTLYTTVQHNSHFIVVWKKNLFPHTGLEDSSLWALALACCEKHVFIRLCFFSKFCSSEWGSRQGGGEEITVILGGTVKAGEALGLPSESMFSCYLWCLGQKFPIDDDRDPALRNQTSLEMWNVLCNTV
jgi:hypothetical protein